MSAPPLIVRCGALGDMILLTPLIRLLAARYGSPIDVLSSGSWTPPLLTEMPEVGELRLLSSRKHPYFLSPSQWSARRWLHRRGRGPVYLCDYGVEIRRLLARADVPDEDIVDFCNLTPPLSSRTELWPDRWIAFGQRDPVRHYPMRTVAQPELYRFPQLLVDVHQRAAVTAWRIDSDATGPLILFQPGNKRTHKRGRLATRQHNKFWSAQSWSALATAIFAAQPSAGIVLCGSPTEFGMLEEIRQACGDRRIFNLARELPIPRLFAMIEQAHSMVSVDSGPAHAAAALSCPLVVLFGAAPLWLWHPLGPGPVRVIGGEKGEASRVDDVTSSSVIAAWRSLSLR